MSSHDEYSSDEEGDEPAQVFLGYVDAPLGDEEPCVDDTFIGGEPVWLAGVPPPAAMVQCGHCDAPMALYVQANAPMEGTLYDRVLYVFGCKKGACRRQKGAVRCLKGIAKDALRMQGLEEEAQAAVSKALEAKLQLEEKKQFVFEVTRDLFTKQKGSDANTSSGANPFGGNPFAGSPFGAPVSSAETASKPAVKASAATPTYAAQAAKAAPPVTKRAAAAAVAHPTFPGLFLYVEEEKITKKTEKIPSNVKIESSALDTEFEAPASVGGQNALTPEALQIASMMEDSQFQHFASTVQHNPLQVLRYNRGGKPLLYTSRDAVAKVFVNADKQVKLPNPSVNPGSLRQFEMQLMPKAIIDLDAETADILTDGMEWGTIICATDVEDYIPTDDYTVLETNGGKIEVGYVEEWCGVQWEEQV